MLDLSDFGLSKGDAVTASMSCFGSCNTTASHPPGRTLLKFQHGQGVCLPTTGIGKAALVDVDADRSRDASAHRLVEAIAASPADDRDGSRCAPLQHADPRGNHLATVAIAVALDGADEMHQARTGAGVRPSASRPR